MLCVIPNYMLKPCAKALRIACLELLLTPYDITWEDESREEVSVSELACSMNNNKNLETDIELKTV